MTIFYSRGKWLSFFPPRFIPPLKRRKRVLNSASSPLRSRRGVFLECNKRLIRLDKNLFLTIFYMGGKRCSWFSLHCLLSSSANAEDPSPPAPFLSKERGLFNYALLHLTNTDFCIHFTHEDSNNIASFPCPAPRRAGGGFE